MQLFLHNTDRNEVFFQREDAAALAYPALSGSKVFSYANKDLLLQVKELAADLFTIRFSQFRFRKNQAIESVAGKKGLHTRVMLQNELRYAVTGIGNIHQPEDAVTMIWGNTAQCMSLYEAGKEYKTLDIYIAPEMVRQVSHWFPKWKIEGPVTSPVLVLPNPCFLTPAVKDIINAILDCPYDEQTSRFYFDLKIREYLYVLLEQHHQQPKPKYRFTPYDIEQIRKARGILLSHMGKPPLTIRELARSVGLNEFKLKVGFKHFYGTGVFETFQDERMRRAKELLLQTNRPVKDICHQAGYSRTTSFIAAFRNYFGYTPGSLRRE